MRSPLSAMAVIACPHCGTRYQVPAETLGPKGREVQCAHCTQSWLAVPGDPVAAGPAAPPPDPDRLFDERTERDLDAAFVAEEKAALAVPASSAGSADPLAPASGPSASGGDPKLRRKRARAFAQRQNLRSARSPVARLRRAARLASVGLLLALLSG